MLAYDLPRARGNSQFALSELFKDSFPVGTILTLSQFDSWAVANNLYPNCRSHEEMMVVRGALRNRINSGGTCVHREEELKQEGFMISVHDHGKNYEVLPASSAYQKAAEQLPSKVSSMVETNRTKIKTLRASSDFENVPIKLQIMADLFESEIDEYQEEITRKGRKLLARAALIENGLAKANGLEGSDAVHAFLSAPAE